MHHKVRGWRPQRKAAADLQVAAPFKQRAFATVRRGLSDRRQRSSGGSFGPEHWSVNPNIWLGATGSGANRRLLPGGSVGRPVREPLLDNHGPPGQFDRLQLCTLICQARPGSW